MIKVETVSRDKVAYMVVKGMALELRKYNNATGYILTKNGLDYDTKGIYGKKLPKYLQGYYNELVAAYEIN